MAFHLRPIDPANDFTSIVEISNLIEPDPITTELLHKWEQERPAGQIRQWHVAVDESGQVVGSGSVVRDPWEHPGRFSLRIRVHPRFRQQGVGTLLYDDAVRFAEQHDVNIISAAVRDNDPHSLRFAEQRGFAIDRHIFDSSLDLATFDESPYAGTIEAAEAGGIRFFSLADIEVTDEARRNLYDLHCTCLLDVPGWDMALAPFEQFQNWVFKAHWYRPDGQIIAADSDRWVGLASVGYYAETNSTVNQLTGVCRDFRGRKLALALKLLANRRAREWGAAFIRTNNDSENAPMLAINRKLGYKSEPGKYFMKKRLT